MANIAMFFGIIGSIQWKNGQDFFQDTLYMDSLPLTEVLNEIETA